MCRQLLSKVYLVTGGTSQPDWTSTLTSTSLLTEGSSAWVLAAPLPSARSGLRAVTVPLSDGGHRVIVTGYVLLYVSHVIYKFS